MISEQQVDSSMTANQNQVPAADNNQALPPIGVNPPPQQAIPIFSPCSPCKGNYLLWNHQVLATIRGYGLEGYIYGTLLCPEKFLTPEEEIWG